MSIIITVMTATKQRTWYINLIQCTVYCVSVMFKVGIIPIMSHIELLHMSRSVRTESHIQILKFNQQWLMIRRLIIIVHANINNPVIQYLLHNT